MSSLASQTINLSMSVAATSGDEKIPSSLSAVVKERAVVKEICLRVEISAKLRGISLSSEHTFITSISSRGKDSTRTCVYGTSPSHHSLT